jgi:hypothetical protein
MNKGYSYICRVRRPPMIRTSLSKTEMPHGSCLCSAYSAVGMPSSSSIKLRQLSANISAYLTRSWDQSWFHRVTWYCELWK